MKLLRTTRKLWVTQKWNNFTIYLCFLKLNRDPKNKGADNQLKLIKPLKGDIAEAKDLMEEENYDEAIALLTKCIEICPWDPELHEKRADCHIAQSLLIFKKTMTYFKNL